MKKVIFTIGVSASGKTTWAKSFKENDPENIVILSRDDIRWELMRQFGVKPCWANWKWKNEKKVTEIQQARIKEFRNSSAHTLIIADTNLDSKRLFDTARELSSEGISSDFKFFDVDFDTAVARDNARENGVGQSVIQSQYQKFIDNYFPERRVSQDETKPKSAIVDIDGTVAHMIDRGPFMWDRVHEDLPNKELFFMIQGLKLNGYNIIFVSGRDSVCREQTNDWLSQHVNFDFQLFMREAGDQRKDTIVKKELYMNHIHGRYNVKLVIDDRPSVVRQWLSMGLKVMTCGNPWIEF